MWGDVSLGLEELYKCAAQCFLDFVFFFVASRLFSLDGAFYLDLGRLGKLREHGWEGKNCIRPGVSCVIVLYYIGIGSIRHIERNGMGTPGNSHGF